MSTTTLSPTAEPAQLALCYKHLRVSLMFMGSIALLCLALWLIGFDPSELTGRSARLARWFFPWGPYFLSVVFAGLTVYWGRALFDRRPQLIVGLEGIHDRRKTKALIPWTEIEDIRVRTVATNTIIELFLKDPERYMGQGLSAPLFALNKAFNYTQLAIVTTGLEGSTDDVLGAIEWHWHQSQ